MSRARCNIAARTRIEDLRQAALAAFDGVEATGEEAECADFDAVLDFCQPRCEDVGGEAESDAWYLWKVENWAVVGDLNITLQRDMAGLTKLSTSIPGEMIVTAIDNAFDYAFFAVLDSGKLKRMLILDEGEYEAHGQPVKAERGKPLEDFTIEEAERLWTSYGLPTFEWDPLGGPFFCQGLKKVTG